MVTVDSLSSKVCRELQFFASCRSELVYPLRKDLHTMSWIEPLAYEKPKFKQLSLSTYSTIRKTLAASQLRCLRATILFVKTGTHLRGVGPTAVTVSF